MKEYNSNNRVNSWEDYLSWEKDMDKVINKISSYVDKIGNVSVDQEINTSTVKLSSPERERRVLLSMYYYTSKYFDNLTSVLKGYSDNPSFDNKKLQEWYHDSEEAITELKILRDRTVKYLQRFNKGR